MLLIVMHNRQDYLDSVVSLLKRENITNATIVERKGVGHDLIGEWTSFAFHRGEPSSHYDKALVAVIEGEESTRHILDLIETDPSLRWLNLEDKGFVCAVPFQKVRHLELESSRVRVEEPGMKIADYLRENQILLHLKARVKEQSVKELSALLRDADEVADFDTFLEDVYEREKIGTTGIGNGVAIPHARSDGVTDFVVALGRSHEGVEFGSLDRQPVKLIFLMGTPKKKGITQYLKILARLTRLLQKEAFRESLLEASSAEAIINIFKNTENQGI